MHMARTDGVRCRYGLRPRALKGGWRVSVRHMLTGRLVTQPQFIIRTRATGTARRALGHARCRRQPQRGKAQRVRSNAPERHADMCEVGSNIATGQRRLRGVSPSLRSTQGPATKACVSREQPAGMKHLTQRRHARQAHAMPGGRRADRCAAPRALGPVGRWPQAW